MSNKNDTASRLLLEEFGITKEEIVALAATKLVNELLDSSDYDDLYGLLEHTFEKLVLKEFNVVQDNVTLVQKVTALVNNRLDTLIDELFSKPFQPIDTWGQKSGDPVTISDLVKTTLEKMLYEKVDYNNKPSYNGTPRIKKYLVEATETELKLYLTKEAQSISKTVSNETATMLGESFKYAVLKALGHK